MNKIENACCFTGHRPQSLSFGFNEAHPDCVRLKALLLAEIERLIVEERVSYFISGMALGVDIFCVEAVLQLRQKYPNLQLEAAIPCEGQELKWFSGDKARYRALLSQCDKRTVVQPYYTTKCMQARNEYMIDHSAYVLAVWNGVGGGTGNAVLYALRNGKQIIQIQPPQVK